MLLLLLLLFLTRTAALMLLSRLRHPGHAAPRRQSRLRAAASPVGARQSFCRSPITLAAAPQIWVSVLFLLFVSFSCRVTLLLCFFFCAPSFLLLHLLLDCLFFPFFSSFFSCAECTPFSHLPSPSALQGRLSLLSSTHSCGHDYICGSRIFPCSPAWCSTACFFFKGLQFTERTQLFLFHPFVMKSFPFHFHPPFPPPPPHRPGQGLIQTLKQ